MGKKRSFKLPDGRTADIDEDKVQALLDIEPDAKEVASFIVGKDTVDIPIENADKYLDIEPDAKPLFEDEEVKKKGSASSGSGVPTDGEKNPYAPNTEIDYSSLQDKKSPGPSILNDAKNSAPDSPLVQSLKPELRKAAEQARLKAEKERKASVLVNQFKKEPVPKGYKPDDVGMETYTEAANTHMAEQNADIEKFIQPELQKLQQQYTDLRESDVKYQEAMAPIKQQIDAYSQELLAKAQKVVVDNHITDPAKLEEMEGELNKAVNEYAKKLEDASPALKERNDFYNDAIGSDLDVFIKNNYKPKTKYFGNGEPIEPFISAIKSESFSILSQNEKKVIIASMWDKLNTRMQQKDIPQKTIDEAKQEFMWYAMDAATHNENGGISQFALREMATKMKGALEEEYKVSEEEKKKAMQELSSLPREEATNREKQYNAIFDKNEKLKNSIANVDAVLSTPDGDINAWLAFGKGFASEAGLPFIKSLNEISTGLDTYRISQKMLKKQPLTPEEAIYMKTVGMADAIKAEMPKNAAYNIGAGLAGSMVFLGEFAALNPVGAIVEEGSANALRLGLKSAGNKVKQAAYKEAIATQLAQAPIKFSKPLLYEALVVKPLSTLIGATAQTLASPNQVINNTIRRMTPQALVMFSPEVNDLVTQLNTDKFNIEGYRTGRNEPMSEALPRGFAQAFTEIFTEKMFTGLSGVSDLATKGLMTRLAKDIPTAQKMYVAYMMSKYKLRVDQVDDFLKNSGLPVGGFIEEFAEEVGSGALQPWLTGDGRPLGDWYDPEKGFNLRTIGETAGVIAGQSLLFRGLGAAATMGKGGYVDIRVHDGQAAFNAPISQKGFDFIGSSLKGKDKEYIKAWAATHITSFSEKEQLAVKALINHLAKEKIFHTHKGKMVPDIYGANQQAPPPNTPPPPPPTPEQQAAEDFDIKERKRGNTGYTIQHQDGTIETPDDQELLEWLAVPANLRALEQGQSTLNADNPSDEVSAVLVEFAKHGSAIATPDKAVTAEKHNGKYVKYKGELGIIHVDEGGKITVETPDKIYDIQGNATDDLAEHGIRPINAGPGGRGTQATIGNITETSVNIDGVQFDIVVDEKGNVKHLVENGKKIKDEELITLVEIERNKLDNTSFRNNQADDNDKRNAVTEADTTDAFSQNVIANILDYNMADDVDAALNNLEGDKPIGEDAALKTQLWAEDAINRLEKAKGELPKQSHERIDQLIDGIYNILDKLNNIQYEGKSKPDSEEGSDNANVQNVNAKPKKGGAKEDKPSGEKPTESVGEETKTRKGDKQIKAAFDKLNEAKTPEEKLTAINTLERNEMAGGVLTKDEKQKIQRIKDNLSAEGYEVPQLLNHSFHQGMRVIVTSAIPDENLASGEEIITKVLVPQVNKDDKMVQTAQIEVTVGTKKGGLTKEEWLKEQTTTQAETKPNEKPPTVEDVEDENNAEDDKEVGTDAVGNYNPKFKTATKIQGDATTIEMPDGETREAEFMVVESDDILASHNEISFNDTEGFPKTKDGRNANSRNYKGDKSAQLKVNDDAANLKSSIVISDAATPDTGVPIISEDGIVLSGNGRTMAIKLSQNIAPEKYQAYKADLLKRAAKFGIDPSEVAKMKKPILVKVDKSVKDYSVKTFDEYNGKSQKEESPIDKAIKRSAIIQNDENLKERILSVIGRHETMTDLFENKSDRKELFDLLVANNIILKQETPKYVQQSGEFTNDGKDLINDVLIATILSPETLEATNNVKAFRNKIINALPVLSVNYKLGSNSLEAEVNDAIMLQSRIAAMGSQDDFWKHLRQMGMFDAVNPNTVIINRMINNGAKDFKKFIVTYNKSMEVDEHNLFGGDVVLTKQQVIDNLKESNLSENEKQIIANLEELYNANEQKGPIGNNEVVGGNEEQDDKGEADKPNEKVSLSDAELVDVLVQRAKDEFPSIPKAFWEPYRNLLATELVPDLPKIHRHLLEKLSQFQVNTPETNAMHDVIELVSKMVDAIDVNDGGDMFIHDNKELGDYFLIDAWGDNAKVSLQEKGSYPKFGDKWDRELGRYFEVPIEFASGLDAEAIFDTYVFFRNAYNYYSQKDEDDRDDFNPPPPPAPPKPPVPPGEKRKIERKIRDAKDQKDIDDALDDLFKPTGPTLTMGGIDHVKLAKAIKVVGMYMKAGVHKFSDMIENAYAKYGDAVREIFDELKGAYLTYRDVQATDAEAAQMDSSLRGITFDDIISPLDEKNNPKDNFIKDVATLLADGEKLNIVSIRAIALANGLTDVQDTELQEYVEAAIIINAKNIVAKDISEGEKFEQIVKAYEAQPTISMRSSERIDKQQYSTPTPMSFLAGEYVNSVSPQRVLEPSAGNGMMLINVAPKTVVANETDPVRLSNLEDSGYAMVTSQDAILPFKIPNVDGVIMNPPFGASPAKEYGDGYSITGLDEQMVINALDAMSDHGRAAIIIGGHTTYASNGSLSGNDRAFLNYLYNYYNVADVINMAGGLYYKQGTSFPTRMILINGRRTDTNIRMFAPTAENAKTEQVNNFNELQERVKKSTNESIPQKGVSGIDINADGQNPNGDNQGNGDAQGERPGSQGKGGGRKPGSKGGGRSGNIGGKRSGPTGADGTQRPDGSADVEDEGQPSGTEQLGGDVDIQRDVVLPNDNGAAKPNGDADITEEKVPYQPQSKGPAIGSVIPRNMALPLANVLIQFGDIDTYTQLKLGYSSVEELHNALAAEQIDGVALAIYQIEHGGALIIGDQTGVGKGRQAAAIIRYAVLNGKKPIFVTEKPHLFSDLYRDLKAIGSGGLNPLIINDKSDSSDPTITDEDGNIIYKSPQPVVKKSILDSMQIPKNYDYAVITYSQLSAGEGKVSRKKDYFLSVANDNIVVMDESHNAGGKGNINAYLLNVLPTTKGVVFLSGTFAKRPENIPIYSTKTAMRDANMTQDELIDAIKKGGVPLQEIMSRNLVEIGQMIRRERDFAGVSIDWEVMNDSKAEHYKIFDSMTALFNDLIMFQRTHITPIVERMNDDMAAEHGSADNTAGTADFGISNPPFASKTFNLVRQLLLSLKVKDVANAVIEELKNGRKPVIALSNTMGAFLADMGVENGDTIGSVDYSITLKRGLDGLFRISEKDYKGKTTTRKLDKNDLTDEGREAYEALVKKINALSTGITISPIDAIKKLIVDAGYSVGELTGREQEVVMQNDGSAKVMKMPARDKKKLARDFNNGDLDVLIINQSGATGISIHASKDFKDKRQRVMISAQTQLDVNTEIQMRGRTDRTGQLFRSSYRYIISPVPAEQRLIMMFKAKLKSLDANTTSSQKSKTNEIAIVDFLNKYGDEVVTDYLKENRDLNARMLDPLKFDKKSDEEIEELGTIENAASTVSGRVALLPVAEQEKFYTEISDRYAALIQYLDDNNANDLEMTTMNLNATTTNSRVVVSGTGNQSPFSEDSILETVEVDVLKKPMKAAEIKKDIGEILNGKTSQDYRTALIEKLNNYYAAQLAKEEAETRKHYAERLPAILDITAKNAAKKGLNVAQEIEDAKDRFNYAMNSAIDANKTKKAVIKASTANIMRSFNIGSPYYVPNSVTIGPATSYSYGIFMGFKTKDKMNPSNITAVFATLDGRRKISVPLSKLNYLNAVISQSSGSMLDINLQNWDEHAPTKTRRERHIITGNLLQAYSINAEAQLITYTTSDGKVKQGILLPENYKDDVRQQKVLINTVIDAIRNGTTITDSTGIITIRKSGNSTYEFSVPVSRVRGGKYFLDKTIRGLVLGENLNQRGQTMLGTVPERNLEALLDYLSTQYNVSTMLTTTSARGSSAMGAGGTKAMRVGGTNSNISAQSGNGGVWGDVGIVKGFYTPSKNTQSSKLQSGGLPTGKFIALDAPFTSTVHDVKDAQKIQVNVKGKKVYNPDGVEGFQPTEDLSKELSIFANNKIKEGKKSFEELMTEFYQSKGYDAYVRLIDGGMRNNERELIIFDRNTPLTKQEQSLPTQEQTPEQQMADAKAELKRAWNASGLKYDKNAGQNLGFMYDPAVDIKRQGDLFKALYNVAKLAIQQAANKLLAINASDFIASIRGYGKLYADITDAHLTDVFNEAKKAFDAKERDQSLVDPQMSQRTPNRAALAHDLVERVKTIYAKFGVPIAEQKLKKARGFFQTHPEIVKISSMFNVAVGAHELMHYIIKKNAMVKKALSGSTVVSNQLKEIYVNHYPGAKDTHAEELQIEEGMTMLVNLWVQNPVYAQQMYGDAYYAMFDPAGSLYNNDVHDMALDFAEIIEDFLGLPANERIGARIRWGQPGVKKRTLHHNAYNVIKYQIYDKLYLAKDVDRMLDNEFKGSGIAPNIAMMRTAKTRMQHWYVRSRLANTRPQTPGRDGNWKEARYNTTVSDYMDLFHDKKSGLTIEEFNQMLVARRQLSDYKRLDKIDADVAAAKKMIETLEIDNTALEAQIAVETDKAILQSLKVQLSANLQNINNLISQISELTEDANKTSDILERNRMSRPMAEEVMALLGQRYAEPARLFDEVQANIVDMMEATGMVSAERANEWRGKDGYASFRRYFDNEEKLRETLVDAVGAKGVKQLTSLFPYKGSDLPLLPATYSQALAINEVMMKGTRNMMWQAWAMAAANNKDVARMFRQRTSSETDETDNIVVWMDGKKHFYQASAEVILFANAIENIQPDKFEEVGRAIAKMLQVSVTGIYLPFALVNLSVDAATRFQLSETGAIPVVHDIRTIYHMLESPVKILVGQMLGKEFDPNIIDQYISMGGKASLNINLHNISAEGVMKQFLAPTALDKAKLAADASVEALSLAVNLTELMGRATEYRRAIAQGKPTNVAMMMAQNSAIDWNQRGSFGNTKGGHSLVTKLLNTIAYAFAQVTAFNQVVAGVKRHPVKSTALFTLITAVYAATQYLIYGWGDDDEKREMANQPVEMLPKFIYLPNSKLFGPESSGLTKIRIPELMGYMGTHFALGARSAYLAGLKGANTTPKDVAYFSWKTEEQLVAGVLPPMMYPNPFVTKVGQDGRPKYPRMSAFISSLIPTAGKTEVEVVNGMKSYPTEMPIIPNYMSTWQAKYQYDKYTTETAKYLASVLDWSPKMLDYYITQKTGRGVKMIIEVGEYALGKKDELDLYNPTQVNDRFFFSGELSNSFYDKANIAINDNKGKINDLSLTRENASPADLYIAGMAVLSQVSKATMTKTTKQIDAIQSYMDKMDGSPKLTEQDKIKLKRGELTQEQKAAIFNVWAASYNDDMLALRIAIKALRALAKADPLFKVKYEQQYFVNASPEAIEKR